MPDLLTHALVGYIIATTLSVRYDWLTPQWVTIVIMGTFIPDMTKIRLLAPSYRVEQLLGIPFDWFGLHTVGGAAVSVLIGGVLVPTEHRRRVLALLVIGVGSHLCLDSLLSTTTGYAAPMGWPLVDNGLPTPGIYLSSDRWPALLSGLFAVWLWWTKEGQNKTND